MNSLFTDTRCAQLALRPGTERALGARELQTLAFSEVELDLHNRHSLRLAT
jgi:hypothetical protein